MIRDIVLGVLATSALTTQTGRKVVSSAGKIGLKMLENNLKNKYNIDVQSIISPAYKDEEQKEEEEVDGNE